MSTLLQCPPGASTRRRLLVDRFTASAREPWTQLALLLVTAQVVLRGWALGGGWFYADDFVLLAEAHESEPTADFLLTPHDSQLMPGGRLASWLVAEAGDYSWAAAAAIVLSFQAAASLACWWMLRTVFGPRPLALGLLAVYLFSPMTLTAFMWWAAAINAVPLQLAFFLAVSFHVRHLRTRSPGDLAGAVAAQVLGLLFFVKAVLIVLPLAAVTLMWFGDRDRPWAPRAVELVVRYRWATGAYAAVLGGYVALYLATTPNPLTVQAGSIPWGELADTMLRVALPTALLGGPWVWNFSNPPVGIVATPEWMVTATWVACAVVVTLLARTRRLDPRAILVVVPYLLVSYLLVARGRGVFIGGFAGLELRYLADALPVLVLGLGLLLSPPQPPAPPGGVDRPAGGPGREDPVRSRRRRTRTLGLAAVVTLLAAGCLRSTLDYAGTWHDQNASEAYVQTVTAESRRSPVRVADVAVPPAVLSPLHHPDNLVGRFFSPLGDERFTAVTSGNDLQVLDELGITRAATVTPLASAPTGPVEGCGYALTDDTPTTIPLEGTPGYFWWMEVYYLAAGPTDLDISYAGKRHTHALAEGAHRLFLQGEGAVAPLQLWTSGDTLVCVDRLNVGDIEKVVTP